MHGNAVDGIVLLSKLQQLEALTMSRCPFPHLNDEFVQSHQLVHREDYAVHNLFGHALIVGSGTAFAHNASSPLCCATSKLPHNEPTWTP